MLFRSKQKLVPSHQNSFESCYLIKPEKLDQPILADHPFFWAGMMLVEVPDDKTANSPADPSADPPLPGQPQGPGQVPPPDDAGLMKQDDQKAEDQKAERHSFAK